MKQKREILHPNNLKKMIIISGQQRSGKTTLTKIISSLEGPVNTRIDFFLDSLLSLSRIKNYSRNTLKEILLLYFNNLIIDSNYGRNLNLKKNEESSIWETSDPNFYLKKIDKYFTHEEIKKNIIKNNEITFVLHNFIEFLDVFPINEYDLKIINIQAHPIDQIYSMYEARTNFKFDNLSREIVYLYKNKRYCLSVGLEDKFNNLNLMQKILLIKENQDIKELKKIKSFKNNSICLNIKYENLIQSPENTINTILKFIRKKNTSMTNKILKENVKRKLFLKPNERKKRLNFINSKLRDNIYRDILRKMITKFDKHSV